MIGSIRQFLKGEPRDIVFLLLFAAAVVAGCVGMVGWTLCECFGYAVVGKYILGIAAVLAFLWWLSGIIKYGLEDDSP